MSIRYDTAGRNSTNYESAGYRYAEAKFVVAYEVRHAGGDVARSSTPS